MSSHSEPGLDGGFKTTATNTYAAYIIRTWVKSYWATAMDHRITGHVGETYLFSSSLARRYSSSQDSLEEVFHIPWVGYVIFCTCSVDECGYLRQLDTWVAVLKPVHAMTPRPHVCVCTRPVKPRKWLQQLLLQLWRLGRCVFVETALRKGHERSDHSVHSVTS